MVDMQAFGNFAEDCDCRVLLIIIICLDYFSNKITI